MELTQMIKTGEILRKPDGNYCFSCKHCSKYFDVIHEIIDHMNELLNVSDQSVAERNDKLDDTEFVDVSTTLEVKHELIEEDSNDEHVNDANDTGDLNYLCNIPDLTDSKYSLRNVSTTDTTSDKCIEAVDNDDGPMSISRIKKETLQVKEPVTSQTTSVEYQCNGQDYLLKCCWCSERFNDFGSILDHFTDEHNKKPSDVHSCEKCRIFFKNTKLLGEHILLVHGQVEYDQLQMTNKIESSKPIQCVVCNVWTNGTKSFDAHTKRVHKMYRILQCYICGIFKKKPSGLLDHLKVHDRFRKYRCYECDNVDPKITNPYDLRSHKCILCNIWFFNHASIRNHIVNVHEQDQIYDCPICENYTFKTELDLKLHNIEVHKLPVDYKCKHCSMRCKSIASLKQHQKSHLTKSNLNLCTICGSKFQRKDYLSRHIRSHGEVSKDFTCYICKKQFQSNGYLKNHIKRHTEKKMHQCDVCGNRFLLAGLLRRHMREHEGEVWKCEQCCKEFSNKSKLTAHEKTHVTERNFRCDVCSKSYKTSKNLRQHKLVHSAERRIKCRICNMTFNQAEHVLHLQTHSNDVV